MLLRHVYTSLATTSTSILTRNPHPFPTDASSWPFHSLGAWRLMTGQKSRKMPSKPNFSCHKTLPKQKRSSEQNLKIDSGPPSQISLKSNKPTTNYWTYAWQKMTSIPTIQNLITSSHNPGGPKVIKEPSNITDTVYDEVSPSKSMTKTLCLNLWMSGRRWQGQKSYDKHR